MNGLPPDLPIMTSGKERKLNMTTRSEILQAIYDSISRRTYTERYFQNVGSFVQVKQFSLPFKTYDI